MREYSTGTYGTIAYFISKILLELPLSFLQCLLQTICTYWLVGFRGPFIYLVLTSWALGCCAASVAVVLGSMVGDVKTVTELAPVVFVPQVSKHRVYCVFMSGDGVEVT